MREPMLSVREVAEMLHVSECTVYRLKDKPDGPKAYKVGRSVRFKPEEIAEYLSRQAVEPIVPGKDRVGRVRFKYVPGMKVV